MGNPELTVEIRLAWELKLTLSPEFWDHGVGTTMLLSPELFLYASYLVLRATY